MEGNASPDATLADMVAARLASPSLPGRASELVRVAERCGFRYEGRLRSHMLVRHSGERRDSLIYGLLPGELR